MKFAYYLVLRCGIYCHCCHCGYFISFLIFCISLYIMELVIGETLSVRI